LNKKSPKNRGKRSSKSNTIQPFSVAKKKKKKTVTEYGEEELVQLKGWGLVGGVEGGYGPRSTTSKSRQGIRECEKRQSSVGQQGPQSNPSLTKGERRKKVKGKHRRVILTRTRLGNLLGEESQTAMKKNSPV